jgi:two-component system, chemotaxis family, response regulator WspF
LRVGIVNDLRVVAESLKRIVAETPGFSVAWVAYDGESALRQHRESPADIVLMDLIMPGLDGAQTTEAMMKLRPTAILVVTATVTGNRELVFAAMGKGALDAVNTPDATSPESVASLRRKLLTVSRLVKSATLPSGPPQNRVPPISRTWRSGLPLHPTATPALVPAAAPALIAIGASTGGPQAIATILRALPSDFHAAIVIVQHLDRQFVPGLQKWLQRETKLPLKLAAEDDLLHRGGVWLADSENHLTVRASTTGALRLHYTPNPLETPHRPSVDVFLESIAQLQGIHRCGVLLTGMGADGAAGLLALRQSGAPTWAQDPASCVVYGMPAVALKLGAVDQPTLLTEIAPRLLDFAGQSPKAT